MKRWWLLCSPLLLAAGPAHAQWSWVHPLPQGHTLYDIVFLDNTTAIAVGEYTTVLVTHDTGNTWSVQQNVLSVTAFKAIERLDANTAVVVGEFGLIARTTDQGATWTPVSVPGFHDTMTDVAFFDATHGIALAGNTVLRSSDGGVSWVTSNVTPSLDAVDMTSATNAVAVSGGNAVMFTTNGGATWTPGISPVQAPENAGLIAVDFLDALHGAIGTTNGTDAGFGFAARCYITTDGGTTWAPSVLNGSGTDSEYFPRELLHPQVGEVLVAGRIVCCVTSALDPWPQGELASTVNSGGLWTKKGTRSAHGLARNNDGVVIVVGEDGSITRRNLDATYTQLGPDYGRTVFQQGRSSFFDAQTGIVFHSDGNNYMFGDLGTHFARTADGGQTWSNSSTSPHNCFDVAYLSANELIAVGMRVAQGAVLRSTNGGATWTQIWTGTSPAEVRSVVATSSTRAVAVGSGGNALIIDNGVVTLVATGGTNFSDIAFTGPSTLLAVGGTDARSTDGGLTWTPIVAPATGVYALDFLTSTRAVGIDANGILITDDVGSTWTPAVSKPGLRDVSFYGANWGVVVGDNGYIQSSPDGGVTWEFMETITARQFVAVTTLAPGHVFASTPVEDVIEFGEEPVPTLIRALDVTARPFGADLRWEVTVDEHLSGFTIRRSSRGETSTIASDLAVTARSYRDEGLIAGTTHEYQLIAVDRDGSYTQSMPVSVTIPAARVELLPNQPNPFNPVTTIRFVVPERRSAQLTIHDVTGRVVATLIDGIRDAGMNTITWNAEGMASGVYFTTLRVGKTEVSQKMVLLK